jgi:hypothetical protein
MRMTINVSNFGTRAHIEFKREVFSALNQISTFSAACFSRAAGAPPLEKGLQPLQKQVLQGLNPASSLAPRRSG